VVLPEIYLQDITLVNAGQSKTPLDMKPERGILFYINILIKYHKLCIKYSRGMRNNSRSVSDTAFKQKLLKLTWHCEILRSHSRVSGDFGLLGCDTVLSG